MGLGPHHLVPVMTLPTPSWFWEYSYCHGPGQNLWFIYLFIYLPACLTRPALSFETGFHIAQTAFGLLLTVLGLQECVPLPPSWAVRFFLPVTGGPDMALEQVLLSLSGVLLSGWTETLYSVFPSVCGIRLHHCVPCSSLLLVVFTSEGPLVCFHITSESV